MGVESPRELKRGDRLYVYKRTGAPCRRCAEPIKRRMPTGAMSGGAPSASPRPWTSSVTSLLRCPSGVGAGRYGSDRERRARSHPTERSGAHVPSRRSGADSRASAPRCGSVRTVHRRRIRDRCGRGVVGLGGSRYVRPRRHGRLSAGCAFATDTRRWAAHRQGRPITSAHRTAWELPCVGAGRDRVAQRRERTIRPLRLFV